MGCVQRVFCWVSSQEDVPVGCKIEVVGIVEIVRRAESWIFVEIGCFNGLVERVSVGLENVF
jgi:hypothetical protein